MKSGGKDTDFFTSIPVALQLRVKNTVTDCQSQPQTGWSLTRNSITTDGEGVIEKKEASVMIFSLGSSADHRLLCIYAAMLGHKKVHEEIKDFLRGDVVGKLSLCLIYELSHNIFHILPTCCYCTESSAEDKLAFK